MAARKHKDWFDKDLAAMLANKIIKCNSDFATQKFIKAIERDVQGLELKDRIELFADQLYLQLGENYLEGLATMTAILGDENPNETGMFTEFYWVMPIAKFVEKYGLDYFEDSLHAIEEITKRNTGEYAIRPYLESYPDKTLAHMLTWSEDDNFHVRRLASEGVRPRLPWAKKLDFVIESPDKIYPILENLKDDPSKYVQKSVANAINDIIKDNPEAAMALIEKWSEGNLSRERKWIIKHALRKLLKAEDPWARQLIAKISS